MSINKRVMIVDDFLITLDLLGFNPETNNFKSLLKRLTMALGTIFTLLTLIISLCRAISYEDVVESIEAFAPTYQATSKMLAILLYRRHWCKILRDIRNFWNWDKYGKDLNGIITKLQKNARVIAAAFIVFAAIALGYFNYYYTFSNAEFAMVRGSICNAKFNRYCYWFYVIYTIIIGNLLALIAISYDILFIAVIVYFFCETKLIKQGLSCLNRKRNKEEANEIFTEFVNIIKHHSEILNLMKYVNDATSVLLLNQFLTTVSIVCIEFFFISFSDDILLIQQKLILSVICLFQMGIYCFAGSIINDDLTNITDYYYNIDWWHTNKRKISKCMVIVIHRSQRNINLTVGGFLDLDLVTFTKVVKLCMSLLTFLQTIFTSD